MTQDTDRFQFLLRQKPICTQSPIKAYLGSERHRELRAEHKLALGIDLLDDRCPNSFNCISADEGCIGRPFPIDEGIHKALESINVEVTIGNYKKRDVYLAKAVVECAECPFKKGCEASCPTQDSFLRRAVKPDSNPPEYSLVSYDDFEKGMYKALTPEDVEECEYGEWAQESLPLDCLTLRQRQVIEFTLMGLEQAVIAERIGGDITVQTVSKHKSRAIKKMTEFGRARKIISEKGAPQRVIDYYINNLTQQEIADKEGLDRTSVTKYINKWYYDNTSNYP